MKKSSASVFRVAMLLVLAAVCALFTTSALADDATLTISVDMDENMMFSTYDVDLYVDNDYVGHISHGGSFSGAVSVSNGTHSVIFYRSGKTSINGSKQITVEGDTSFQCNIHAYNDRVSISNVIVICSGNNTQKATPTGESKARFVDLTEPVETESGIKLTITGVRQSNGSDESVPAHGNVFVLVGFILENNSDSIVSLSANDNFEAYEDGFVVEYSYEAELEATGRLTNIPAGKKGRGEIGFEVSSAWQELEIHYFPVAEGSEEYVYTLQLSDLQ